MEAVGSKPVVEGDGRMIHSGYTYSKLCEWKRVEFTDHPRVFEANEFRCVSDKCPASLLIVSVNGSHQPITCLRSRLGHNHLPAALVAKVRLTFHDL
jgi:hypothetical protein